MAEDTFQSMVVVLTIVVFIAAAILLVGFRLYRRRRSRQRGLGYEESSLSSSPATSSKPRVSLGMPNFPKVQNKLKEMYPKVKFNNEDESDSFALLVYYVHFKRIGAGDRCLYQ